jgi:protein-tyrosine-phosphatase
MSRPLRILVVCSGNTCRSPLAAAMLTARLAVDCDEVNAVVSSAGTAAWDGAPASEGAYLVALERGLDLSTHRARMLTSHLVAEHDLILTVSEAHAHRVADLGGAEKVHTLHRYASDDAEGGNVPDPYGGEVEVYRATADVLEELIDGVATRLVREHAE